MKRNLSICLAFVGMVIVLGIGSSLLEKRARVEAAAVQAPMFEVDPFWPKPLPNHWLIGMTIGVSVDAQDNVWIIHRQDRKSTRLNSSHANISYAVFCLKKKNKTTD